MLRHGQTEYNATKRMQGQLDTVLSAAGIEQAHAVAPLVAKLGVEKVIASDLRRASDTAQIVARDLGLSVELDARLRETHLGAWQGKTHGEIDAVDAGARAHWRNTPSWAPPEGESRLDVAKRSRAVVEELLESYCGWEDSAVLLVAHGGTIASLTASLLELETRQYPLLKGLGNAHYAQLLALPRYGGQQGGTQWYLEAWNQGAGV